MNFYESRELSWSSDIIEKEEEVLSMEWVKNQATSLDLYKTNWLFVFLSVSLIAEEPYYLLYRGASTLLIEYQVKGPEKQT